MHNQLAALGTAQHMTLNAGNFVIGSVVLTLLRRLSLPVLVVTANSAKLADGARESSLAPLVRLHA